MSDPALAHRLIRQSAAAIPDLTGVVWVKGPDAVAFVDGLVSQNVAAMSDGETKPGLLLAPNGKLRAPLHLLVGENRIGLACDAARADGVCDDLTRFKIRVDAQIDVENRRVWDIWGVEARSSIGSDLGEGRWLEDERLVFDRPFARSSLSRMVVIGDPPPIPQLTALDITPTRIELGEPIMGIDLTDKTIPQEGIIVDSFVDFDKGCYLGQELVARIDSRGHVNQRLAGAVFTGTALPPTETDVLFEDQPVGLLSSVAWSTHFEAPIALGMIRVGAEAGAAIEVGGVRGTITDLPMVP